MFKASSNIKTGSYKLYVLIIACCLFVLLCFWLCTTLPCDVRPKFTRTTLPDNTFTFSQLVVQMHCVGNNNLMELLTRALCAKHLSVTKYSPT